MATPIIDPSIRTINREILAHAQKVASKMSGEAAARLSMPVEIAKRIAVLVGDEIHQLAESIPTCLFSLGDESLSQALSSGAPLSASRSELARPARIWLLSAREVAARAPDVARIFYGINEQHAEKLATLGAVDVEMAIERIPNIEFRSRLPVEQWRMLLDGSAIALMNIMNISATSAE